jgi:pimeloyl-ACP methyl ester carboxylesterase
MGFPFRRTYFRELIPLLATSHRVIAPDYPGFGAQAYLRDLPKAELHLLDAGHFALESHAREVASLMLDFLKRHP